MEQKSYTLHKGVNKPIEFVGLKAQYILIAGAILVGDVLLFAILYVCKVNPWICITTSLGVGASGIATTYKMSRKYGQYGWQKMRDAKKFPKTIRYTSREIFTSLKK